MSKVDTMEVFKKYIAMRYALANTDELRARLERDAGLYGRAFECAVKSYMLNREILAVSASGEPDAVVIYKGKSCTVEIKCGQGKMRDTWNADLVVYAPELDPTQPLEWQAHLFTAEEWRTFMTGYTGRGHLLKPGDPDQRIQPFWTEAKQKGSKPIAEYINAVCFETAVLEDEADNFGGA